MKTRQEEPVDLAMSYYEKAFQKLAEKPHESLMQVIESNEGLFESTRRKHFRKRKVNDHYVVNVQSKVMCRWRICL